MTLDKEVIDTVVHPNGEPIKLGLERPKRNDDKIFNITFPDSYLGKLLKGLLIEFLIKQEHRFGWARKSAFSEAHHLTPYPNETVASHQWGVAMLVMTISREPNLIEELPNFDRLKAIEMALLHDVAEVVTGDITPVDGISPEEKHKAESEGMNLILGSFPKLVGESLNEVYNTYENRKCIESKFVKDCDKLDFMLHSFLLELQGFTGFSEFYPNSLKEGFSTKIASDLAKTLITTRNDLVEKNLLYVKDY